MRHEGMHRLARPPPHIPFTPSHPPHTAGARASSAHSLMPLADPRPPAASHSPPSPLCAVSPTLALVADPLPHVPLAPSLTHLTIARAHESSCRLALSSPSCHLATQTSPHAARIPPCSHLSCAIAHPSRWMGGPCPLPLFALPRPPCRMRHPAWYRAPVSLSLHCSPVPLLQERLHPRAASRSPPLCAVSPTLARAPLCPPSPSPSPPLHRTSPP